jgi:hypothetical protein
MTTDVARGGAVGVRLAELEAVLRFLAASFRRWIQAREDARLAAGRIARRVVPAELRAACRRLADLARLSVVAAEFSVARLAVAVGRARLGARARAGPLTVGDQTAADRATGARASARPDERDVKRGSDSETVPPDSPTIHRHTPRFSFPREPIPKAGNRRTSRGYGSFKPTSTSRRAARRMVLRVRHVRREGGYDEVVL